MRRREFIALVGGAAAMPFAARAQERVRHIGILMNVAENDREGQVRLSAFLEELAKQGWTDGRNVRIAVRWTAGDNARVRQLASEIAALAPDVILVWGAVILRAVHEATSSVPLVFVQITDPVRAGFVASLARPGGRITGFTQFEYDISGKWLQLLKEMKPALRRAAVLWDPTNAAGTGQLAALKKLAPSVAVELRQVDVLDIEGLTTTIRAFPSDGASGLIVLGSSRATAQRDRIVSLASSQRLPAIYPYRDFIASGGLMTYGPDTVDQFRRAAGYVDRILKGEKPTNLPVEAPTKFELTINLKTAKSLGLTVPTTLLARADEVIE